LTALFLDACIANGVDFPIVTSALGAGKPLLPSPAPRPTDQQRYSLWGSPSPNLSPVAADAAESK